MEFRPALLGMAGAVTALALAVLGVSAAQTNALAMDESDDCPAPVASVSEPDALRSAQDELTARLRTIDPAAGTYTEDYGCVAANTLLVYRVPGNPTFDRAIGTLAEEHRIPLRFVDTRHSLGALRRISHEVIGALETRVPGTAIFGLSSITPLDGGYVDVRVEGNVGAARLALADFGSAVHVREGRAVKL